MAYLVLNNGTKKTLTSEQGIALWKALHNPANLDEAGLNKLRQVRGVYLNWRVAPEEYIKENLDYIIPLALNDWIYSRQGKPLKPQSQRGWQFARTWGLWENGVPTWRVTGVSAFVQPVDQLQPSL